MRGRFLGAVLVASILATSSTAAWAKPSVVLVLGGAVVSKDAKGVEHTTPIADTQVKPGELIRYTITATNKGDQPAFKLVPAGKIPQGTAYEAGSASLAGAERVEYSLDGGKNWSTKPMVKVHTPTGDALKPADPTAYTNLHWVAAGSLVPSAVATYSYEVRVK